MNNKQILNNKDGRVRSEQVGTSNLEVGSLRRFVILLWKTVERRDQPEKARWRVEVVFTKLSL